MFSAGTIEAISSLYSRSGANDDDLSHTAPDAYY